MKQLLGNDYSWIDCLLEVNEYLLDLKVQQWDIEHKPMDHQVQQWDIKHKQTEHEVLLVDIKL